jgi:DNA-binding transcriptional ArsR family regulator
MSVPVDCLPPDPRPGSRVDPDPPPSPPGAPPAGSGGEIQALQVVGEADRVSSLLDPERRRLLRALGQEPDSASGLARRLGESRQRLNYHLRALERAELVEVHEERPRRGFTERIFRPTALRFLLDPGAVDDPARTLLADPAVAGDRLSATYVLALSARVVREVAALRERADGEGRRLATAGMEAEVRLRSPEEFHDFVRALSRAVAGVTARFQSPEAEARPFRVIVAAHPGPAGHGKEEGSHEGA